MARYAYDKLDRREELFVIDRDKFIIYPTRPMTCLRLHRELADMFDEPEWMFEDTPTYRITDDHIQISASWKLGNPEFISGRVDYLV